MSQHDHPQDQPETATLQPEPATLPEADAPATVHPAELERDEWKKQAQYHAADLQNSRRRHAQELEQARQFAVQNFARDLLSVADNFARALAAPAGNEQVLRDGVAMVAATLQSTFAKHGITLIAITPGQPLNPDQHQVMTQVPSDLPAHTIVAELQPGFLLNGRLLRPAFVSVSSGPEKTEPQA